MALIAPDPRKVTVPEKPKSSIFSGLSKALGGTVTYERKPEQPLFVPAAEVKKKPAVSNYNVANIREAIGYNESRGVKNPYSFSQPSSKENTLGNALGRYQVTEAELRERSKQFTGKLITPKQFLSDPKVQDRYLEGKANFLLGQGFTPEDVAAAHRGGFSDRTDAARKKRLEERKGYVSEFLSEYNRLSQPKVDNLFIQAQR